MARAVGQEWGRNGTLRHCIPAPCRQAAAPAQNPPDAGFWRMFLDNSSVELAQLPASVRLTENKEYGVA